MTDEVATGLSNIAFVQICAPQVAEGGESDETLLHLLQTHLKSAMNHLRGQPEVGEVSNINTNTNTDERTRRDATRDASELSGASAARSEGGGGTLCGGGGDAVAREQALAQRCRRLLRLLLRCRLLVCRRSSAGWGRGAGCTAYTGYRAYRASSLSI